MEQRRGGGGPWMEKEKKSVVEKRGRGRKGSRVGPVSPGVNARLCDHSRMHWFFLSFPLAKLVYTESGGEVGRGALVAGKKRRGGGGWKARISLSLCVDSRSDWIYQRQMRSAEAV